MGQTVVILLRLSEHTEESVSSLGTTVSGHDAPRGGSETVHEERPTPAVWRCVYAEPAVGAQP